jgi:hypothetical protein
MRKSKIWMPNNIPYPNTGLRQMIQNVIRNVIARDPGERRPCGGIFVPYVLKKEQKRDDMQAMQQEPEGWGITLKRSAGRLGCRGKKTAGVFERGDVVTGLCGCAPHGRGWWCCSRWKIAGVMQ